jgi:hydroxymethylbilane synthase
MTEITARAAVSRSHRSLRLDTRGSPLALAQAGQIARRLQERSGHPAVLVTVATPGDGSTAPIERLGATGVFTSSLREALLRGDVDLVVHSGKDLPTAPAPGLRIAVFPAWREDPRDALIWPGGTSMDTLPRGARIGTRVPRRAALLRAAGRQPQIVPMRGNVAPGCASSPRARPTLSSWPWPACPGWGCSTRSPARSTLRY